MPFGVRSDVSAQVTNFGQGVPGNGDWLNIQTAAGNGGTLTLSSSNSTAWAGYGVEILAA